jgi:hypothetical protein
LGNDVASSSEWLDLGIALARSGDRQGARRICARLILREQPCLASASELRRDLVYLLLISDGLKLLSRTWSTVSGCRINVSLSSNGLEVTDSSSFVINGRDLTLLMDRWRIYNLQQDDQLFQCFYTALDSIRQNVRRAVLIERDGIDIRGIDPTL